MRWRDAGAPVRMRRVGLVAPREVLRTVLVRIADAGVVELEHLGAAPAVGAGRQLLRLCATEPDLDILAEAGRADLVAGEIELRSQLDQAVVRGDVAGFVGWTPAAEVPGLHARLSEVGGAVVPLPNPRGADPPTMLHADTTARQSFAPLVETYGTVPYADIDPSVLAGFAYLLMFGMMFGDAGHGALLVLVGLVLRTGRPRRLAGLRKVWLFVVGSGLVAIVFGLLYGEFFGPTGVVPTLWLTPLEAPVTLMAVALGLGAVLLAGAQILGTVNRWREGGWPLALSSASGIAGAALLVGVGVITLGVYAGLGSAVIGGVVVMGCGVALAFLGFLATSGGGATGGMQAAVEVFDAVTRVGANLLSFVRLAAFGLTHAALSLVVWEGVTALWSAGGARVVAAVVVFLVGNALAFGLEALVAGVQALRLEYYELFSRVFIGEGRPFRPWHIPTDLGPEGAAAADRSAGAESAVIPHVTTRSST